MWFPLYWSWKERRQRSIILLYDVWGCVQVVSERRVARAEVSKTGTVSVPPLEISLKRVPCGRYFFLPYKMIRF
jgi:hypothetical protein